MDKNVARLYQDSIPKRQKFRRALWQFTWCFLFFPTPDTGFRWWRIFLLRLFGAKIGKGCKVQSTVRIWAPWNLLMGNYACLASQVDCYNVSQVSLGDYSTVSQRSFICTAGHDISSLARPLTHSPVTINSHAWVCAEAYIGPGVVVEEGAVVAARAVATKLVPRWSVVAGAPAKEISKRVISG